jgi:large subunit ribosomal protein L27Ae
MVTHNTKTRKKRGNVSMGHGRVGKHRLHPSGRGNAGGQHHHRTYFDKYHPGYFGKVGMRWFHRKAALDYCPTINVEKLWTLVAPDVKAAAEAGNEAGDGKAVVIDVTKAGYFKVLGKGPLPTIPVVVKARFFSKLVRLFTACSAATVWEGGRLGVGRRKAAAVRTLLLASLLTVRVACAPPSPSRPSPRSRLPAAPASWSPKRVLVWVIYQSFPPLFLRMPTTGRTTDRTTVHVCFFHRGYVVGLPALPSLSLRLGYL